MGFRRRSPWSLLWAAVLSLAQATSSAAAQAVFYPNANITDTSGRIIQAHSGAIIQDMNALAKGNNVWYWFGQNNSADTNGDYFLGVSCYKTYDFASWTDVGPALIPKNNTNISPSSVVERPKVLYNKKNAEYVMWFHSDNHDYSLAQVGFATSKKIEGPYTYNSSFSPLGHQSRDMTVWQDPDTDEGYLVFATDNNANLAIASMNADYTNVTGVVHNFTSVYWEAPGFIKHQGTIYLLYSPQDGWTPDANGWMSATSMAGPWSTPVGLAPYNSSTYLTQNGYDVTINGTKRTTYLYQGDRWNGNELFSSTYSFLPLQLNEGKLRLHSTGGWTLNAQTGQWSDLPYTNITAASTASKNLVPCPATCAGGKAANMTSTTAFTFTWHGQAGNYVVQIQYSYQGAANAFSQVVAKVDGKRKEGLALIESGQNKYPQQAPIPLKLQQGSQVNMTLVEWDGQEVLVYGVNVYKLLAGSSVAPPL